MQNAVSRRSHPRAHADVRSVTGIERSFVWRSIAEAISRCKSLMRAGGTDCRLVLLHHSQSSFAPADLPERVATIASMIRKEPMLLQAVDKPFDREHFDCELKIDGYRMTIYGPEGLLFSRNGKSLTARFKELRDVTTRFGDHRAIVDGEVAAFVNGVPSFTALQNRNEPATFVAFDLLQFDGESTLDLPLSERRLLLAQLIPEDVPHLVRSRAFPSPVALYEQAVQRNLEGIVIKDTRSRYIHGPTRTRNWLKVKTPFGRAEDKRRQESWGH
jgi:ATP-dependent DNA ligase